MPKHKRGIIPNQYSLVQPTTSYSGSRLPTIDEGDGGKHLAVKQNESGVEWVDPPTELPAPGEGDANKVLAVKNDASGYELLTLPIELPTIEIGDAGKLLVVNDLETGVEFKIAPVELPPIQEGDKSKVLAVKSDGSGVEYVGLPADELPTPTEGDAGKVLTVKSDETGYELAAVPETADELPAITEGDAGKLLAVKSDETGPEWVSPQASELPSIQEGDANKVLAVKSDETGVEFVTPSAGGGESKTTEDIDLYVDPATGSDDNPGTDDLPFATIAKALSVVPKIINHYVCINLLPGTYTENVYIEGFKTEITPDHYNYKGLLEIYAEEAVFTSAAMTDWNCSLREVWRTEQPWNQNPTSAFFIANCSVDILIDGSSATDLVFNMGGAYATYGACAIFVANCDQVVWVTKATFAGVTGENIGGVWAQDSRVNVSECAFDYCNAFYVRADGSYADAVVSEATETNISEVYCRLMAIHHGRVTIGAISDPWTLNDDKDLMLFGGKIIHHSVEKALKKDVTVHVTNGPAFAIESMMRWDTTDYPFPTLQSALDSLPKFIDSAVTIVLEDGNAAGRGPAVFEGFHGAGKISVFVGDTGSTQITAGSEMAIQLTHSTSVKATLAFVGNDIPIAVKGYGSASKLAVVPYAESGSAAIVAVNNGGLIRFEHLIILPVEGEEGISSGILAMNSPVYITGSVVNEMAEVAKVLAGARVELNTLTGSGNVKLYDCAANGHLSVDASTIANCAKTGSNTIAVDSASVTWPELIRAFGPRIWSGETDPSTAAKAGDIWINATAVKIRNEANNDWITIS